MSFSELFVSDGTTRVDLIAPIRTKTGFSLLEWTPKAPAPKGGGTFQSSVLSDGRKKVHRVWDNIIDEFELACVGYTQNDCIRQMQDLRRLLIKADAYSITGFQKDIVYVGIRGACETNIRYAMITDWRLPEDDNPFVLPFYSDGQPLVTMDGIVLTLEHAIWNNNIPGTSECVEVTGTQDWAMNYPLVFDGATQLITVPAAASINDLPEVAGGGGLITAHGWIKADSYGEGNVGHIAAKGSDDTATRGWHFTVNSVQGLKAFVDCANQDAISGAGLDEFTADGEWHHVLMTYSEAGAGLPAARTIYLAIDGVWVTSYVIQQVSIGVYDADNGDNMVLGNNAGSTATFDGEIGWMEVRDDILRTPDHGDFTPPPRCPLPEASANSAFLGIYEGDGTAIDDLGPNANDGTAANDEWGNGCGVEFGRGGTSITRIYPLVYDGDTQKITVAADVSIDDLPEVAGGGGLITVHGWIHAAGYGENNQGRIAIKGDDALAARGWHFYLSNGAGLSAYINCAVAAASAQSGLDEFTADGEWHHVLMTYSEAGAGLPIARTLYLAIDGVWVTSYSGVYQPSQGAYVVDNADDMIIGNNVAATRTFDGEIGWMEVVAAIIYSPAGGNFTPPSRCPLPTPDASAKFLGIHEGSGTHIEDMSGNANIGTAVNDIWGSPCVVETDDPDCADDETYIANKHNMAQLTHIYVDDGGVFGPNLIAGALPFNLLPAVPVAGDAVYFGINTALPNTGPFCDLVFDILAAQTGITGIDWEFWDSTAGPGWAALTVQDNTDADGVMTGVAFDTTGVKSVHWEQHADWIANAINGVTCFWVRAVVTAAAGATAPTQQNRSVYTIVTPYIDVAADQVAGDMEALARHYIHNQSDHAGSLATPSLSSNRVIMGLRSLSRGEDFTPYINLGLPPMGDQNHSDITIVHTGIITSPIHLSSPTGYAAQFSPVGPIGMTSQIDITIATPLLEEYQGIYHCYLRGIQTVGAAGDIRAQILTYNGALGPTTTSDSDAFTFMNRQQLLDLGEVSIAPMLTAVNENIDYVTWILQFNNLGAGATRAIFYDLILMPIDEWAAELDSEPLGYNGARANGSMGRYIDVDAIVNQKVSQRCTLRTYSSENILAFWAPFTNGKPMWQSNVAQRMWFVEELYNTVGVRDAKIEIAHSYQGFSNAQYQSFRGNR